MGESGQASDTTDPASRSGSASAWFDTTEVRWFGDGAIPASSLESFRSLPGIVPTEARTDTYLADGAVDVGVKMRDRGSIETKVRLPYSGVIPFGSAARGRIEEWRKVAESADLAAHRRRDGPWIDVAKTISKRFRVEVPSGSGCQTELTSLVVGTAAAWTLAFEAWGPPEIRRRLLSAAVEEFLRDSEPDPEFAAALRYSMGYPEWLATIMDYGGG